MLRLDCRWIDAPDDFVCLGLRRSHASGSPKGVTTMHEWLTYMDMNALLDVGLSKPAAAERDELVAGRAVDDSQVAGAQCGSVRTIFGRARRRGYAE